MCGERGVTATADAVSLEVDTTSSSSSDTCVSECVWCVSVCECEYQ